MKKEQGFTLIEIIAVLVILGILAAVAIPQYRDLQRQARTKGLDGAFAAGASQLAMQYGEDLLANPQTTWSYSTTGFALGEFTASIIGACGAAASSIQITGTPYGAPSETNLFAASTSFTKSFTICE